VSDVIEDYIRRHPSPSLDEAFRGFLGEARIHAWVGTDAARRDRLYREFTRVWGATMSPRGAYSTLGSNGRSVLLSPTIATVRRDAAPPPTQEGRQLRVLCPACASFAVYSVGTTVSCTACGAVHEDMLALIPVTPVGPFAFVFGSGWKGAVRAVLVGAALVALYGVLRWS
jgi:ribosomal protein S27E